MEKMADKAKILIEALPYIKNFYGKNIVIKYGGSAMDNADLRKSFALDVILLKYVGINPVIIHGGGPQIGNLMKRLGKEPQFIEGMRVTDAETMQIVEMVLVGSINTEIVGLINSLGGKAVGLSGKDGELIRAKKMEIKSSASQEGFIDIGFVGEIEEIRSELIKIVEENGFIPVIAPVGVGSEGETYNINADLVAGEIAASLAAEKLIHLTDVTGIMARDGTLISTLKKHEVESMIKSNVITGGMLPKVESCLRALSGGARKTHIIDGRVNHAILLELFTDEGVGTEIIIG